jgi:hypothetical protein
MIVYVEPLFLRVRDNERLQDYVMDRGEDTPHIFIVFTVLGNLQASITHVRADGFLLVPFIVPRLVTSVEEAQRLLKSKSKAGQARPVWL